MARHNRQSLGNILANQVIYSHILVYSELTVVSVANPSTGVQYSYSHEPLFQTSSNQEWLERPAIRLI